ncbi:MAG: hypothetical protein WKG07_37045 [Hymenobacter sp.]
MLGTDKSGLRLQPRHRAGSAGRRRREAVACGARLQKAVYQVCASWPARGQARVPGARPGAPAASASGAKKSPAGGSTALGTRAAWAPSPCCTLPAERCRQKPSRLPSPGA